MTVRATFKQVKWTRLYYYSALFYAFLIPLHQKAATLAILVWVGCSLLNYRTNHLVNSKELLLLPVLFLTYALGLILSGSTAFPLLESKMSLLAFPLVFFLHRYHLTERNNIQRALIFGLLFSAVACLLMALYRSFDMSGGTLSFRGNVEEGKGFLESVVYGGNYFFGNHFSLFHQTVYYAMYLSAGIAIILFKNHLFRRRTRMLLVLFFTFIIFLVSNKAGILAVALVFLFKIIVANYRRPKKIILIGVFTLMGGLVAFTNPRIKGTIGKLFKGELTIDHNARYDFKTRLLSWDAALTLIAQKPLRGYGMEETQAVLNRVYREKGYKEPLRQEFNAHDLFLQVWLENGLAGLIVVVLVFLILFLKGLRAPEHRSYMMTFFIIFLINAFFESIFSRFSGISFFAFLVCFIFSWSNLTFTKIET
jgi:O-antigen ligase